MKFLPCRRPERLLLSAALLLSFIPAVHAGPLLTQDFNGTSAWPQLSAAPVTGITVKAAQTQMGTIDVADTATPSGAAVLTVQGGAAPWTASLTSGLLTVRTTETNLAKLTLSFDSSVSSVRPVRVLIESFNAKRQRTGGLQGVIYPAAADFYQRSALDLSTMAPVGTGAFRPTDPYVRLTWKVSRRPAKAADDAEVAVRVDNVEYASPAFYVSPTGSDSNDGRSEKTAFASPQTADRCGPARRHYPADGRHLRSPADIPPYKTA